ncbi:MAG: hypothetical protein ACTSXX_10475 [Candidatus Baldrarchaeia archaeon]
MALIILTIFSFVLTAKLWSYVKPKLSWNFKALTILLVNVAKGEILWPPSIHYLPQTLAYEVFEALNKRGLINKKDLQQLPDIRTNERHVLTNLMEYILIKGLSHIASDLSYKSFYEMKVKEYKEQDLIEMFENNDILINVLQMTPEQVTEHGLPQMTITLPEKFRLIVINRTSDSIDIEIKSKYCSLVLDLRLSGYGKLSSIRAGPAPEIMGMPIDTTANQLMYIKQLIETARVAYVLNIKLTVNEYRLILSSSKALPYIEYAANLAKSLVEFFDWEMCAMRAKRERESYLYETVKTIEKGIESLERELEELKELVKSKISP